MHICDSRIVDFFDARVVLQSSGRVSQPVADPVDAESRALVTRVLLQIILSGTIQPKNQSTVSFSDAPPEFGTRGREG